MEEFLNILMGVVPAVVVGVVSYLLINRFLEAEKRRHIMEIKKESVKFSIPVKMQAYERMILLLERLDPVKSVNRVIKPGMTSRELQKKVIMVVRPDEKKHYMYDCEYLTVPHDIVGTWTELAQTRKFIHKHAGAIKYAMIDDDIIIKRRKPNKL